MTKKIAVLLVILMAAWSVPSSWAVHCPAHQWLTDTSNSSSYPAKAGGMLLRGIARVAAAPVELIAHTYDGVAHHTQNGLGLFTGLGTGVLNGVDSIFRGVWDVVTFAVPDYHGAADNPNDELCKKMMS